VYLNSGQNARRGAAEALPLSPRARFAAATPASVPAGWLRGGALAIDRLDELSAAFRSERLSGVDGVVTDVWDQLVPPGVAPTPRSLRGPSRPWSRVPTPSCPSASSVSRRRSSVRRQTSLHRWRTARCFTRWRSVSFATLVRLCAAMTAA